VRVEFLDVVRRRRMVRNYDPDRPVPPEVRERILAHALHAPSAGFAQGWGFLVLEEPADRERFWATASPPADQGKGGEDRWLTGMRRAPLIIVAHSNPSAYLDRYAEPDKGWADRDEARWPVPYWHIDAGFASLLMLLTVVDEGLGACFFGIPPDRIGPYRAEFGVPEVYTPIGALSVGYRAPDHRSPSLARGRTPVEVAVHRGRWRAG
jgi:nitroreductase